MGGFGVNDSGEYEIDAAKLIAHVKQSTNPISKGQINSWPVKLTPQLMQLYYPTLKRWIEFRRVR
jgi:hypothetical protein